MNLQGLAGLQTLDQGRTDLSPELCAVTLFSETGNYFLYYLSPLSSLILCLLTAYCREQSCDGLHIASYPGEGGGWWGLRLPLCFMLLE